MIKRFYTIRKSAEITADEQSDAVDVSDSDELAVYLNVTEVSSGDTLDVTIEDSPDGNTWYTHTAFTQVSAPTKEAKRITNFGKFIRVNCDVTGSDVSITFEVLAIGRNQ